MKEFYLERIKEQEQLIDMVKLGFKAKMKELGEKLEKEPTIEDAEKTVEIVRLCKEAIKDEEKQLTYYKEEYEKESGEPYSKTQSREILFGDAK